MRRHHAHRDAVRRHDEALIAAVEQGGQVVERVVSTMNEITASSKTMAAMVGIFKLGQQGAPVTARAARIIR